jgi:hypothetical protein
MVTVRQATSRRESIRSEESSQSQFSAFNKSLLMFRVVPFNAVFRTLAGRLVTRPDMRAILKKYNRLVQ